MEHTRTDSFLNFQLTNICQKEVISEIQKQRPDVFYKESKFLKIYQNSQKTPALESLFNKVYFIKKRLQHTFSCEYCEIFKNIYFEKHLRTVACGDVSKFKSL